MSENIEDYAMIGDTETAALVSRDGMIEWMCCPTFSDRALFASLLGDTNNGMFSIRPVAETVHQRRRYVDDTLVLETDFATADGAITLVDFMPLRDPEPTVVRIVVGRRGRVRVRAELLARFDFGSITPWIDVDGRRARMIGGPDAVELVAPVPLREERGRVVAELSVGDGERAAFVLQYYEAHKEPRDRIDAEEALRDTVQGWRHWAERGRPVERYRDHFMRSVVTLKALTYAPTGAIVAAPTASLPEKLGGVRNWDYRYCWLRDATFTLYALLHAGYHEEATAWRDWLLRATAGEPKQVQILYGIRGEHRVPEMEVHWLKGYDGSKPVHIGNAAHGQFQLDVPGEIMDTLHLCRRVGLDMPKAAWRLEKGLLDQVESKWDQPDKGIWEVRGRGRRFTHSQVMCWVALDRGIKAVENFGMRGPVERWRALRSRIHDEVCREAWDDDLGTFTQFYGAKWTDAALLQIAQVGFLPPNDPRVRGTVKYIEKTLQGKDGLVCRYPGNADVDGLPPGEGKFIPCSFWLADNYVLMGRMREARDLYERLLDVTNDVGLVSEEYDSDKKRLVGNFPQAFSHVSLMNTARNLEHQEGPSLHRSRDTRAAAGRRADDRAHARW